MKNGNLLLLIGILLLSTSCKRHIEKPTVGNPDEQVIALYSGAVMGRAANVGIRTAFETGDQIGVIAVFDTDPAGAPNWATKSHFENRPAAFASNTADVPAITTFGWGPDAQGGVAYNQYYPSRKRKIYLYSYYPYVANPTTEAPTAYVPIDTLAATDAERQPKLNVTLVHGAINGGVEDVLKKQPDVLRYAGVAAVASDNQTSKLEYSHALAQIRFTVRRPNGSSPCVFKKIVLKTTAKASLNLATGEFAYEVAATDKSNRRDAVYTIEMPTTADNKIPEEGAELTKIALDILNPANEAYFNYLMVLPLLSADSQLGEIILTCDFGKVGETDVRDFMIPLDALSAWQAGKLNTMAITVSQYSISLTASITPWGIGEEVQLPAE